MTHPLLEARGLVKRFGESLAVDGVDLALPRGKVVGLVGENGAGKSTLLDILSGLIRPDAGTMAVGGRPFAPSGHAGAGRLGISRVFQEQSLIPEITVCENLLIGSEARFARLGQVLRRRSMVEFAAAMVEEAGARIDVRRRTGTLSFSERQLVEIIRACLGPGHLHGHAAPVVLLDEPTASLERGDEEIFLGLVARLRRAGSLLFVSHRLHEVLALCDRIVVLKDGRRVAEVDPLSVDERDLHRLMVGRDRDRDYYHETRQRRDPGPQPAFAARSFRRRGAYAGIDLEVAPVKFSGSAACSSRARARSARGSPASSRPTRARWPSAAGTGAGPGSAG